MPTLYMHIGHGKTGSSYIQSSLAASVAVLAEQGIEYPHDETILAAKAGKVSSGNARLFPDALGDHENVLFSSEWFFERLFKEDLAEQLRALSDSYDIRVLLFIRDPVSHAVSQYGQAVKRNGFYAGFPEVFEKFTMPDRVRRALDLLGNIPRLEVTTANYSAVKDQLLSVTEKWLSVPPGTLVEPPVKVVNRSLTLAEMELQKALNKRIGAEGQFLANAFCNHLPEIQSDEVRPPLRVQEQLWSRLQSAIDAVNARVPEEARYVRSRDVSDPAGDPEKPIQMDRRQLSLIAKFLAEGRTGT